MPSGVFATLPVDKIVVLREDRQRKELVDIDVLADSIKRLGLINPITVDDENVLIAGERRLTAVKSLGWTHIPVQRASADNTVSRAIELEENVKRVDLPWQDQIRAVQDYHRLRSSETRGWAQADTAAALGYRQNTISEMLAVAQEVEAGNKRVLEAPKYSVAIGVTRRKREREAEQELEKIGNVPSPKTAKADEGEETIQNIDFLTWVQSYKGPRFNLIHCDFPYGIGADSFAQGGAAQHGGYVDDEDTYWKLCQGLAENLNKIATESCHLIFWYSMKYHNQTIAFFERNTDFVIDPFPLIWMKTDNAGILPDPQRGPRRIYETALFGRRGDRKVVQAVANAYGAPTVRERHMSEKPEPMLRHFFRMVVDETSIVLDPTCGSGSAIRAAESLKAKHVLGLEINPEFAANARRALKTARDLRKVGAELGQG